jgi:hypothetical protein
VAQRIKRLSSIENKLRAMPKLRLTQMQDIGGCRAVVKNMSQLRRLVVAYDTSRMKHELVHVDDYIDTPRSSGYRSIHRVYRYYSDRSPTYADLKIEMQLRTPLQHAWATTVEVVGMFTRQGLKNSLGDPSRLRFFALMGTIIASRERCNPVPDTPSTERALVAELRVLSSELDVRNRLRSYPTILNVIRTNPSLSGSAYFLLSLDTTRNSLTITSFRRGQLSEASERYLELEKNNRTVSGSDAVLVSADGVNSLSRAYPNYFADTVVFAKELERALRPRPRI